jgi:hypothetical protein
MTENRNKRTGGPWHFDPVDGFVFQRRDPLTRYVIAELQSSEDANGYLLAAAPELLEACQDAHDKLHECTAVLSVNDAADVAETMAFLRVVIAKARLTTPPPRRQEASDMDDLVKLLRWWGEDGVAGDRAMLVKAANRIEALEATLRQIATSGNSINARLAQGALEDGHD